MALNPNSKTSILFHMLLFILGGNVASAAVFILENHCTQTVWPGISGNGAATLGGGGFTLQPGSAVNLTAPSGWSGRIWARTGCSFDGSGNGKCVTGDCAGGLKCTGSGVPPATLAEFTIGNDGFDLYDVSLVDGYNVGMSVQATEGCGATGCAADLNAACPAELQVRDGGGAVVACKSACTAFNTAEYCCTGDYSSPGTCPPTRYSDFFKSACPLAYSYAFDEDGFDLGACLRSDYIITFCPISLY